MCEEIDVLKVERDWATRYRKYEQDFLEIRVDFGIDSVQTRTNFHKDKAENRCVIYSQAGKSYCFS